MLSASSPQTPTGAGSAGVLAGCAATIPARNKLSRLRPIEVLAEESLLQLESAEQEPSISPRARALLFRDALMVVFFCFHPIRLRSFAGLRLGKHIVEHGGCLLLTLPSEDTKGHSPYEA